MLPFPGSTLSILFIAFLCSLFLVAKAQFYPQDDDLDLEDDKPYPLDMVPHAPFLDQFGVRGVQFLTCMGTEFILHCSLFTLRCGRHNLRACLSEMTCAGRQGMDCAHYLL